MTAFALGIVCGIGAFITVFYAIWQYKTNESKANGTPVKINKSMIIPSTIIAIIVCIAVTFYFTQLTQSYGLSTSPKPEKHPCAICHKTEGTRQINNNKIGGEWDENWYCKEHYADAWQYYYGNNK